MNMKKIQLLSIVLMLTGLASAQTYPVDTIKYMGSLDKYINLVFLGDGYLDSEMDVFAEDARNATEKFFSISPWKYYENYFNVFMIKTPSEERGATHTSDSPVNNFYGTTYGYNNIDRLLYPKSLTATRKVLTDNFPQYDVVVMIVNDEKYGGAGSTALMTFSKATQSIEIFYHEVGHGFANLADEYWLDGYQSERPNMTQVSDRESVKWKNWVGSEDIDVYPFPENDSWYRPHQACRMQYLYRDYCAVCRQAIVEAIHKHVNPIDSYEPDEKELRIGNNSDMTFKLNLIKPNPNTLEVTWMLNGETLDNQQDTISINDSILAEGNNELVAMVEDTTSLIRIDNHATIHSHSVHWQLQRDESSNVNLLQSVRTDFVIYPVPFESQLKVSCSNANHPMQVVLADLMGTTVVKSQTNKEGVCILSTNHLANGVYVLSIYDNGKLTYSRKVTKK